MSAPSAKEVQALAAAVRQGLVPSAAARPVLAATNAWLRAEIPQLTQWEDERLLRADRIESAAQALAEALSLPAFRSSGDKIVAHGYGDDVAAPDDEIGTEYTTYTDDELGAQDDARREADAAQNAAERRVRATLRAGGSQAREYYAGSRLHAAQYILCNPDRPKAGDRRTVTDGYHQWTEEYRLTNASGDGGLYAHGTDFDEPDSILQWMCVSPHTRIA